MFDSFFMKEALKQAKLAKVNNEVPVGAIIVDISSQEIIARGFNQVETYNNALLHAEVNVINIACSKLKSKFLTNCDLYVTLEPCTMCAAYISFSRIKKLFYAASDKKYGSIEHGIQFFSNKNCYFRPEIYIGILSEEAQNLMLNFFSSKRNRM